MDLSLCLILYLVFTPFLFGILSFLIGRRHEKARDWFAVAVTAVELAAAILLAGHYLSGNGSAVAVSGGVLYPVLQNELAGGLSFTLDGFRVVYALITALMWAGTTAFGKEYFLHEREHLNRYWFFVLVTLGATEGVMLSGDFMTSFIFFEILSFTSFTWVIHEETEEAVHAGYTYLFIAVIGGLVLFMGLAMLSFTAGTLVFEELPGAVLTAIAEGKSGMILAAAICILFGFGAKAGMFPVHIWLPKAHPVAPSPGSALLSGILTKVGVYGILMTALTTMGGNTTFGLLVLIIGMITMALGALLALFSVNLKRTLACSSMSQIGFILTGVGMMVLLAAGGEEEGVVIATSGLMLHMVNHSLIKLTLFMAAGVVVMNLHTLVLDDIRGWGRNKWFLKIAFALGALGISGVPCFNGYISKTLLHESIVEGIHHLSAYSGMLSVMEWIFLCSGGLTFAYMLKLFICIFVEKNSSLKRQAEFDKEPHCMNRLSTAVIFGSSLLMVILGQPAVMNRLAAVMSGYHEILEFQAFTFANLKGGLISLGIGAAVYLIVVRKVLMHQGSYVNRWPAWLDLENLLYRPVLTKALPWIFGNLARVFGENLILRPLCKAGLLIGQVLCRLFDMGLDGMILAARKTFLREVRVRGSEPKHPGLVRTMSTEISEAAKPLVSNFTFALMMTCIGIVAVLVVIVLRVF